MTSPKALELGTYYHLFNRGTNRENIFFDQQSFHVFLTLYSTYAPPVVETFAYCLLRNHFHLLIRVKTKSEILRGLGLSQMGEKQLRRLPSQRFSNFFNAYAKKTNRAFQRTGSLFQHPFRRVIICNEQHLRTVIAYIHKNPQHHRMVSDYREWPFSSYHVLNSPKPRSENPIAIAMLSDEKVPDKRNVSQKSLAKEIFPLLIDDIQ